MRLDGSYRMELFRSGFHVLHDEGLAEEMVQETSDITRRPSSRPLLPVEDFQLTPNTTALTRHPRSLPSTGPSTGCLRSMPT